MFHKSGSSFMAIALGAIALASIAAQPTQATNMGARVILKGAGQSATPGGKSSLNPQPLPPRGEQQAAGGGTVFRPGSRIMINPQPLPPKQQNGSVGIK